MPFLGLAHAGLDSAVFWPAFLLVTILEEKAGASWLQTGNVALWLPVAFTSFVLAGAAPLFHARSVPRKIMASVISLILFVALYGIVVMMGASFFHWGD